jgi:uncharacterized membrane protein YhaH (DUF805 family)
MFKNLFSFEGRIRRTEYGLSILLFYGYTFLAGFIIGFVGVFLGYTPTSGLGLGLIYISLIPGYWVLLAQGAKRCHDRGNSGWYQIIPFYVLWMLFADSINGPNEYGPNPKGIGNPELVYEKNENQV